MHVILCYFEIYKLVPTIITYFVHNLATELAEIWKFVIAFALTHEINEINLNSCNYPNSFTKVNNKDSLLDQSSFIC